MTRLWGAVAASVCFLGPASATLSTPKALPRNIDRSLVQLAKPADPSADFQLTPDSEVLLDGKPCAFKDVPATAKVVRIEVTPDRRTVLRIEFRSAK